MPESLLLRTDQKKTMVVEVTGDVDFAMSVVAGERISSVMVPAHVEESVGRVRARIAREFAIDSCALQLWSLSECGAVCDLVVPEEKCELFRKNPAVLIGPAVREGEITIFLKVYDSRLHAPIQYFGTAVLPKDSTVAALVPKVSELLRCEIRDLLAFRDLPGYLAIRMERWAVLENGWTVIVQSVPWSGVWETAFRFLEPPANRKPFPRNQELTIPGGAIDVSLESLGIAYEKGIQTVDEYYDFQCHLVYIVLHLHRIRIKPLGCLRIPFSAPFERIEKLIEQYNDMQAPITFFISSARDQKPVARSRCRSLREAFMGQVVQDDQPIDIWIKGDDHE